MKIELKNIHFSEQLSQETNAFSANLYINDVKAGAASNHGYGGATDYLPFDDEGRKLIQEAEVHCKSLPPEKFTVDGKEYTIDMNLEHYIDNLLNDHLRQKDLQQFRNKASRASEKSIVVGVPDQSFKTLGLKFPVDMLLIHPKGPDILKDILIKRVASNLKEGEIIMNTNIPEKILKEAGLNEKQYAAPKQGQEVKKSNQKRKGRGI
ncbi:hypothetical protein [Mucilaginibacter sp.]|uniref:hypothetical protein n=1 Tax=Mucilaginibacter sp. TaxID=1882438 RepID=UPI002605D3C8|nr:hypothetical protein [Mucilaginibacter sp.]MDB5129804.1 hypothetical protein [Mucilaginibacter sp.]